MLARMPSPERGNATLLIVGDVHGHWTDDDRRFLEEGDQDLVLFVGDLGDEDVEIVRAIAAIDVPKVVILGNHDAWQSFSKRRPTEQLLDSLSLLGDQHLAYGRYEVPAAGITLIGGRPYSWGGVDLRSPEIYSELCGVRTMRQSAAKIVELARQAEHKHLAILAHNGPIGLSSSPQDIYGKDFGRRPGGDWGDRDLALAIDQLRAGGRSLPAVIAGHMHDHLCAPHDGPRTRFVQQDGTTFINPAVVPRVRRFDGIGTLRHYVRTRWAEGRLLAVEEIWVDGSGVVCRCEAPEIVPLESAPR